MAPWRDSGVGADHVAGGIVSIGVGSGAWIEPMHFADRDPVEADLPVDRGRSDAHEPDGGVVPRAEGDGSGRPQLPDRISALRHPPRRSRAVERVAAPRRKTASERERDQTETADRNQAGSRQAPSSASQPTQSISGAAALTWASVRE